MAGAGPASACGLSGLRAAPATTIRSRNSLFGNCDGPAVGGHHAASAVRLQRGLTAAYGLPSAADDPTALTVESPNTQDVVCRGTDGHVYEVVW